MTSSRGVALQPAWVRVRGTRVEGRLIRQTGEDAIIETAVGRIRVATESVEKCGEPGRNSRAQRGEDRLILDAPSESGQARQSRPLFGDDEETLDLHSCTVADVEPLLDSFLDRAFVRDLMRVTIIHGKGSGKLRQEVHRRLRSHAHVISFELADVRHGSWGATVAVLA